MFGLRFLNIGAEETRLIPESAKIKHLKKDPDTLDKSVESIEIGGDFSFWLPGLSPEKSVGR